jgi:hypothetical protein
MRASRGGIPVCSAPIVRTTGLRTRGEGGFVDIGTAGETSVPATVRSPLQRTKLGRDVDERLAIESAGLHSRRESRSAEDEGTARESQWLSDSEEGGMIELAAAAYASAQPTLRTAKRVRHAEGRRALQQPATCVSMFSHGTSGSSMCGGLVLSSSRPGRDHRGTAPSHPRRTITDGRSSRT